MSTRAGRVRELARSSHSKVKLVWHQFSIVQFPRHQFVWKARSVQFGATGPSASVQLVQFSSQTLPALTRIDLTDSAPLRLGSDHQVSNCLGGAEEQL